LHARARLQIFIPANTLGAPLKLVKAAGVEFVHADDDSARCAEIQVRVVKLREVSAEIHAAGNRRSITIAHLV